MVFVTQNFVVLRFILSVFIAAFRWQPLCRKQFRAFTQNFQKKSLFISATLYEKHIVREEYCIAHHDEKMCFLPTCKHHIILLGGIEEMLQKLDTLCFTCQHVDLSTRHISCSSTTAMRKLLQSVELCLTMCEGQSPLTKETEAWTKCRELQKRESWEKSLNNMQWVLSKEQINADHWLSVCRKKWKSQKG